MKYWARCTGGAECEFRCEDDWTGGGWLGVGAGTEGKLCGRGVVGNGGRGGDELGLALVCSRRKRFRKVSGIDIRS